MSLQNKPKNKLKLCHLADVHLGYRRYNKLAENGFNQREIDVSQAFREAIDRIIAVKPDIILVAGDLFHSIRPSNAIVTFTFKQIKRLANATGAKIILLAGNHDTPKRIDSGSLLRLFQEIEGVFIADSEIKKFDFQELNTSVTCLPHAVLAGKDKWQIKADDKFAYNILLTHAQIGTDFFSDFGGADLSWKEFVAGEWDYIALGHVHLYQEVRDNAAYSGSLEYTSKNIWQEAEHNKGFLEVNLPDKKYTFYSLTSPREVIKLPFIDASGLSPDEVMNKLDSLIDSVSGGIDGKIIRIDILNFSRDAYALLDHKQIKKWKGEALNLMIDYKPPQEQDYALRNTEQRQGLKVDLKEFCEKLNFKEEKRKEISDCLSGYLDKIESLGETVSG